MKITAITNFSLVSKLKKNNQNIPVSSMNHTMGLSNDIFVKNTQNISFKADGDKFTKFVIALAACQAGLALTAALVDAPENDYLFNSAGKMTGRRSVLQKEAALKKAVNESNIDLSEERFTYADPINGKYANPAKGIDIDFVNNKYIDPENGIFIDKEHGVSAVYRNGAFEPIVIDSNKFNAHPIPSILD